jgi:hypothetical protein
VPLMYHHTACHGQAKTHPPKFLAQKDKRRLGNSPLLYYMVRIRRVSVSEKHGYLQH